MIKLQLLLRHPAQGPQLDPALRARLEAHGMAVTGSGCATVTAEIAEDAFDQLFDCQPEHASGFATGPLAAPCLRVPPDLLDTISTITLPPRHTPTHTAS